MGPGKKRGLLWFGIKFMKRSFSISLLLHGGVLILFLAWGIPLDEGSFGRNVIQVLLVAEEEEGREEGQGIKEKNGELKSETQKKEAASRNDSREKKITPEKAKPIIAPPPQKPEALAPTLLARQDKKNPKQEPEGNKIQVPEKERRTLDLEGKNEPQPGLGLASQSREPAGESHLLPPKTLPAEAPFGSAPTVLASGSSLSKESISLGGGRPSSTGGTSRRMSRTESSSSEGDSILAKIVGKIEAAKRYPRTARRMGIQGTATVRFKLKPDGQLEKIELLESSGSKILDDASLETVREAAPLPYKEGWLKVGIVFKIL